MNWVKTRVREYLSLVEGMFEVLKRRQQVFWCTAQVSYLGKLDTYGDVMKKFP